MRFAMTRKGLHIIHPLTDLTLVCGYDEEGIPTLQSVCFGRISEYQGEQLRMGPDEFLHRCSGVFRRYLDGEHVSFDHIPIDIGGATVFQKAVWEAARRIPPAHMLSYARLAQACGRPRAVRAVASALRRNRYPLVIPCHRVIRGDGAIGGFCGVSKGKLVDLKRRLLELERRSLESALRAPLAG